MKTIQSDKRPQRGLDVTGVERIVTADYQIRPVDRQRHRTERASVRRGSAVNGCSIHIELRGNVSFDALVVVDVPEGPAHRSFGCGVVVGLAV